MTTLTPSTARKVASIFFLSILSVVPSLLASAVLADSGAYLIPHETTRVKRTRSFVSDGFHPVVNGECRAPEHESVVPVVDQSPPQLGVLVDPVVIGVYWPGAASVDPLVRALFPDFVKDLFDGPYWAALMPQYVGSSHGSYLSSHDITLLTVAPSTTVMTPEIGPEIAAQVLAGTLPAATENTMYVVHFPPGITIVDPDPNGPGTSCEGFCALHFYHFVLSDPPTYFTFNVHPDFTQSPGCQVGCGVGTTFDKYTETLAHEIFEATTNPYGAGWVNQCDADGGAEIADLCQAYGFYVPRDTVSPGAPQCPNRWAIQAVYSNAAIAAHGALNACEVTDSTTDSTCVEPVAVCGDSIVEGGEQCDDGNDVGGDCCSATCEFETIASSCTDGNVCTNDACDGAGSCIGSNNTDPCDDGFFCTVNDACNAGTCSGSPRSCEDSIACTTDICDEGTQACVNAEAPRALASCLTAGVTGLTITDSTKAGKDKLSWQWGKGAAFAQSDVGTPQADTIYTLCVYDTTAAVSRLATSIEIASSPTLWTSNDPKGMVYKDKLGGSHGVTAAQLKTGIAGKTKVKVSAGGTSLLLPPSNSTNSFFSQSPSVTVQLVSSVGKCWTSQFTAADTTSNTARVFKAVTK